MTKDLTHVLFETFVRTFSPQIERGGVCNGFTSMWLQAALTSKKDLAFFYNRLDEIALELKHKTPAQLKEEIEAIYHSHVDHLPKTTLTEEELKKTEFRAIAEAVAIQQDPDKILKNKIHQENKEQLYPLTASKKIEEQHIKFNIEHVGLFIPTLSELEHYLEKMQTELQMHPQSESIGFMIDSSNHSTGVHLDSDSGKFHFLDINTFGKNPTYHSEINAKELAALIFDSFFTKKEDYCPIKISAVSTTDNSVIISTLKNMAQTSLLTNRNFLRQSENKQHIFALACRNGDIETVALLLKEPDIENILNTPYGKGSSPLYLACKYGHTEIVKLLLATKNEVMIKNIEKPNLKKHSALDIAKEYDQTEIVALLKAVIPPWKPVTFRYTVNPMNYSLISSLKRKAEDDDLDERPAKKANTTEEMEQDDHHFNGLNPLLYVK